MKGVLVAGLYSRKNQINSGNEVLREMVLNCVTTNRVGWVVYTVDNVEELGFGTVSINTKSYFKRINLILLKNNPPPTQSEKTAPFWLCFKDGLLDNSLMLL